LASSVRAGDLADAVRFALRILRTISTTFRSIAVVG